MSCIICILKRIWILYNSFIWYFCIYSLEFCNRHAFEISCSQIHLLYSHWPSLFVCIYANFGADIILWKACTYIVLYIVHIFLNVLLFFQFLSHDRLNSSPPPTTSSFAEYLKFSFCVKDGRELVGGRGGFLRTLKESLGLVLFAWQQNCCSNFCNKCFFPPQPMLWW